MGPRLIVWAPCYSPSTSFLPTLDPDSLFAASVLQARRVSKYSLCPPSSLFHSKVPCLEETMTEVVLADDLDSIERYSRKHLGISSLLEEDDDDNLKDNKARRLQWAKRKALQSYISSCLHPLIHQILFSVDLYSKHTAKAYQSGLSVLNRSSLINRLRKELRLQYAVKSKSMENGQEEEEEEEELRAILSESNAAHYMRQEDQRERQDLANRGGIFKDGKRGFSLNGIRGDGLLQEEKLSAAMTFSEMRLRTYSSKVFKVLADALESEEYFYSSNKPSLLDLRLFSLLAPVILPASSYPILASSCIPTLLRSTYPTLVSHTERIQKLLWPVEVQSFLESNLSSNRDSIHQKIFVSTPGWPSLQGREEGGRNGEVTQQSLTIRAASSLGRFCGQTYYYASSQLSPSSKDQQKKPIESVSSSKSAPSSTKAVPTMTEAERKEAKRVAIGRWIWISSAVIGMIGTAFASGLLAIEVVDEEETQTRVQMREPRMQSQEEKEKEELKEVDDAATEVDDDDDEFEAEVEIVDDEQGVDEEVEEETELEFELEEDE